MIINKIPPQELAVEKTILGSMLIDRAAVDTAMELLNEDCFYSTANRNIFICMQILSRLDIVIDLITLLDELKRKEWLDAVGTEVYLAELTEEVSTTRNIETHCRILIEKMKLRKLITLSQNTMDQCFNNINPDDVINEFDKALIEITDMDIDNKSDHISEITPVVMEEVYEARKGQNAGITTGFIKLDETIGYMQGGDYIIMAGRPSMGKTALAMNIASNCAVIANKPVLIFSLEMSKSKLIKRMFSSECEINGTKLRTGNIDDVEYKKMGEQKKEMDAYPIYIKDKGYTIYQIRTIINRYYRKHGVRLVVIDYLQLMRDTGLYGPNRRLEIGERSRVLKMVAKDLNIPIIALCQLSRKPEERTQKNKRPLMSDLKEAGEIEQDADIIMFLFRGFVYGLTENPEEAELIIGKARDGPIGTIDLRFKLRYSKFSEPTDYEEAF